MIKDNQRYLNILQVFLDLVLVALMYMLAWYLRFESSLKRFYPPIGHALPMEYYFDALIYLIPIYLILNIIYGLYNPRRATRFHYEFASILKVNIFGLISIFVVLFFFKQTHFSRAMILIFFVLNTVSSAVARSLLRRFLRFVRKRGYNLKHVLLIGYSRSAEAYIRRVSENPEWGYVINGILDDHVPIGTRYRSVKVVGVIDDLQKQLEQNQYDEITITLSLDHYDRLEELVALCEKSGVHTKFVPDYTSLFPSNPYTEDIQGLPVINIRYVPLTIIGNRLLKRATDIAGSLFAILLFSPIMLIAFLTVKLTSRGGAIFMQERIGLHGKPFMMYKFRTMAVQSEKEEKKGWTTRNDPRVTPVGHFLRKTSIDEMPQFFNVLMGKMSLVGPRPERPQFVEKFKEEIPRYMVKHQVRPGITGWAQVNGYRGDTSIRKRIEYDIYYIENWTYGFDIRILIGTVFHGFRNKNAY